MLLLWGRRLVPWMRKAYLIICLFLQHVPPPRIRLEAGCDCSHVRDFADNCAYFHNVLWIADLQPVMQTFFHPVAWVGLHCASWKICMLNCGPQYILMLSRSLSDNPSTKMNLDHWLENNSTRQGALSSAASVYSTDA